ncbi:MAG: hypothetical protein PHW74_12945 [Desulfobacca sp.]|nr:hypothetical protein [Desulfobacca sp.]
MANRPKNLARPCHPHDDIAWQEIELTNARLRHFRGVAAGVMNDALQMWREIWEACQDPRSWEEILDDSPAAASQIPVGGWAAFYEKLHFLGTYIDYAKRLCEGSLEQ